jgi:hypothetical protein
LGPGQEKHLPHELGHVVQQKEGRVKPTVQLKGKVNINDDSGLEKEADVLGQKANSVGKTTEKESKAGVVQQKAEEVLQGKFIQGTSPHFSKTQPIQLNEEGKAAAAKNNVTKEQIDAVRDLKGKPLEEIEAATKLTKEQIATAQARLFGDVKVNKVEKGESVLKPASPWDKWFINSLSPEEKEQVLAAKARIPTPQQIFTDEAIAKHLGKFAKGAHAFIDPETSGKIKGTIPDSNFTGWGADANFVAPLGEAEDLHQRALKEKGIITIEEELGIGGFWWSRSDRNFEKQMVRWTIPEPQNFKLEDNQPFLSMATGNETGALVHEWVAGGFTLGGMTEAVVRAIPRGQLMRALDSKPPTITSETVVYSKTPYNIGEKGPGTLPPTHEKYVPEKDWKW